ncbi:zinc ABC transporter ATP-binding protein AztA [Caulobacter sp. 17J80-11]|uniref:zinc ABC transporter ATP-binding protein AztA n=1 Tax=Caulobacter sp. 17J80-11 TaxID=2763502 RepID=UPI001653B3E1|nr:zinc ABC transporter ATP-binding protein AztA [Caulobacter sp. 17J80-11]MBC6983639.1 ABC transporter ATP-binding protein [Caulobacter sp. 17J80-11]
MSAAVRLHDVTLGYERHPAVHHLDGVFEAGRLTAVVGPNGSGKSTLLRGVAGALEPLSGRIELLGLKPRDIAYLPQDPGVDRNFPMTLGELVALGFWNKRGLFGGLKRADRERLHDAFAAVGLHGFENRPLNAVSGGQLQRALFARVLLQDARLILLDEPFSAVDQKTTADLVELIQRWPREGRAVIVVLHDLELARDAFTDALLLAREKVAWGPARETLRPENLLKARRLSEAFDAHAHVCRRTEDA